MDSLAGNDTKALVDRVARVWCEVLDIPEVDICDNFFDLGGTSFQLLLLKARLDIELATASELVDFFRHPTVAELAEHVYRKAH
ncbi:phosphopantetheine-binding protein [Nocardia sp. NPDC051990]|uniref:phosphopantetheine-binding protein n=1 Tax=Nocardia sp. NPDC051990 TaxID=3155285 RepID=UPI00342F20B7